MAYKKEEMKKKQYLKELNKFIEKKQGFIYFISFIIMLAIIPASSKGLATLLKTLEFETLTNIIKYIFTLIFISAYIKMLVTNIKKNKGVKYEKNIINKM